MKVTRQMLEGQLENNEQKLKGLRSSLTELNAMTANHATDKEHFQQDLMEAEHNISFYEGEVARLKQEIGKLPKEGRPTADNILPHTAKQGIGPLLFSSIGLQAFSCYDLRS